ADAAASAAALAAVGAALAAAEAAAAASAEPFRSRASGPLMTRPTRNIVFWLVVLFVPPLIGLRALTGTSTSGSSLRFGATRRLPPNAWSAVFASAIATAAFRSRFSRFLHA